MSEKSAHLNSLPWTGERMIPFEADTVTEFFHWQRYLYFQPWYENRVVVDAASGEGYGTAYAAQFAKSGAGIDLSAEAVRHADAKYLKASFSVGDVCDVDYSGAEVVLSFETIEHLPEPGRFLDRLSLCPGAIVISTPNRLNHSPGNRLGDKPLNEHHVVEWTPSEFAELIAQHFPGRRIRMLSQENRFPGLIREGLEDSAKYAIAVVDGGELPNWPRIGISMPTCNGGQRVQDAIYNMARFYPGELEVAVVANGSSADTLSALQNMKAAWPHIVHIAALERNLGYGQGANRGLDLLTQRGGFDLFGVSNDDVIPSVMCLTELTRGLATLQRAGRNPGAIGPVSNSVNGCQCVEIGGFQTYREMMERASAHERAHHSELVETPQLRGLFFLATPECLSAIGGFDPIFGLGNFEDDDWNVRSKLAGFSLWIAPGAFLYHAGSTTFKELGLNYGQNIDRNLKLFLEKWGVPSHAEAMSLNRCPGNVPIFTPLEATAPSSGFRMTFGLEEVDLVYQATDTEFAAAVMLALNGKPRDRRLEILNMLDLVPKAYRCAA
jgi:GT2 family glycosyltransferase/SAM-dependent methyltransferase